VSRQRRPPPSADPEVAVTTGKPAASSAADDLENSFRDVMASVCAPVVVITAMSGELAHGTTVSAFASLSLRPPMVLIALDRSSELLTVIQQTGQFGVNILGLDQSHLALRFARKGGTNKFSGVPWQSHGNVPRLAGATSFLACDVAEIVTGGDHLIVLGNVHAAHAVVSRPPLTYHQRSFGTHKPLEDYFQWPQALTPSVVELS
jgi:flavin reductase (DIM6/NTAB) family NADH-FMN oxidoreductase RutF